MNRYVSPVDLNPWTFSDEAARSGEEVASTIA
jgi:hypothetical protein